MNIICFTLIALIVTSCNSNINDKGIYNKISSRDTSYSKSFKDSKSINKSLLASWKSKSNDTLIVDSLVAILYSPDTVAINKLNKETSEDDLNEVAADNDYYRSEAMSFLDSVHIPIIYSDAKIFIFITDSNKNYTFNKEKFRDMWGIILFDKHKKPFVANLTDIEEGYTKYFEK